jgi:Serine/threonine protein kinase
MSTVYLAVQENLGREVALKVISWNLSDDPKLKKRFLKEGRIVAKLNHPNIVTIYDIGTAENQYYISMEYIAGKNLKERIAEGLTLEQSVHTVIRIARALEYAHRRGIVHRDIKPKNILFRDGEYAVLMDFGIAKIELGDVSLTKDHVFIGTPNYMSPERAKGEKVDARSDLYSLGAMFYEMLTGVPPYIGEDAFATALKHVNDPIPQLPKHLEFLQSVLNRLMAKKPDERFREAQEFIQALDQAVHEHVGETSNLIAQRILIAQEFIQTQDQAVHEHVGETHKRTLDETLAEHQKALIAGPEKTAHQGRLRTSIGWGVVVAMVVGVVLWQWWESSLNPQSQRVIDRLLGYARTQGADSHLTKTVFSALLLQRESKSGLGHQIQPVIDQLLKYASDQLADARLTEPVGDNAYETYSIVLAFAPGNEQALTGLVKIVGRLEEQALTEWQQGNVARSWWLISEGLRVDSAHRELLALQRVVAQHLKDRRRQKSIKRLLVQAEQQLVVSRLTEPKGDNAFDTYSTVLAIAPNNAQALTGLAQIAEQLEHRAREAWRQGDVQGSLALIDQGLKVDPHHGGLHALQDAITPQPREQDRLRRLIAQWLEQAHAQLQAGRLTEPPGDNAFETYQKILAADPAHQQAHAELNKIPARIEELARSEWQQGWSEQGLSMVEQGLKAFPQHSGLMALRTEIAREQEQDRLHRKVAELLAQAKRQFARSQFIEPQGNNANETYQKVLALDPDNARALAGLQEIGGYYKARARRARNTGQLEYALTLIRQGLQALPDHSDLLALQENVIQQLDDKARERQLTELLTRAQAQMSAARYTQPGGDNASETYRMMLTIAPDNEDALVGLSKIAQRFEQQARAIGRFGDLEQSLSLIDEGLKARPKHPGLIALRQEVTQALKTQHKQRQVEALLASAEQQLAALRLTTPKGDNAYKTYREVLAIAPGNQRALAGIQRIAERYAQLARSLQRKGDLKESLTLIQKGLAVVPEHTRLLALRDEITREGERRRQEAILAAFEVQEARNHEVSILLAKAQQQFEADQLTRPKGNNAWETFEKIMQIDPDNRWAQEGLQAIAGRLEAMARAKQREGGLQESLSIAEDGLRVVPSHTGLQALKDNLKRQIEEKPQAQFR